LILGLLGLRGGCFATRLGSFDHFTLFFRRCWWCKWLSGDLSSAKLTIDVFAESVVQGLDDLLKPGLMSLVLQAKFVWQFVTLRVPYAALFEASLQVYRLDLEGVNTHVLSRLRRKLARDCACLIALSFGLAAVRDALKTSLPTVLLLLLLLILPLVVLC